MDLMTISHCLLTSHTPCSTTH